MQALAVAQGLQTSRLDESWDAQVIGIMVLANAFSMAINLDAAPATGHTVYRREAVSLKAARRCFQLFISSAVSEGMRGSSICGHAGQDWWPGDLRDDTGFGVPGALSNIPASDVSSFPEASSAGPSLEAKDVSLLNSRCKGAFLCHGLWP